MTLANLTTEWARLAAEGFVRGGIRRVVISPGSRSTPYALALLQHPELTCFSVVDERAAAFFALGQARVSGLPSLLLCTSGTAAASYLPAVIEASLSGTPLVVATADRPLELQACGAPQTVDQVKLYGDHVRGFFDLGTAENGPALRFPLRIGAQACLLARWPTPGPVHVNLRARKPLGATAPQSDADHALTAHIERLLSRPTRALSLPHTRASDTAIDEAAELIRAHRRGILVAGPAPPAQRASRGPLMKLAETSGFPSFLESSSQLRCAPDRTAGQADAFATFLTVPEIREATRPELVVQIGSAPVASPFEALLSDDDSPLRIVVTETPWPDPYGTATHLVLGDVRDSLERIAQRLVDKPIAHSPDARWLETLHGVNRLAWNTVEDELSAPGEMIEGAVTASVAKNAPTGSTLVLGNSLAIRLIDLFTPADVNDLSIVSQRGASGIDGLIAGAAGCASVKTSAVTALIGDISAFHDIGSLRMAADSPVPLVIVVLQNFGGRIFEFLPYAKTLDPDRVPFWTTPHQDSFEGAEQLFGCRYAKVNDTAELDRVLSEAYEATGCTLIEAVCKEHGSVESSYRITSRLRDAWERSSKPTQEV